MMIPFPESARKTHSLPEIYSWRIVIKDLILECSIGVWDYEKSAPQSVKINVECDYAAPIPDDSGEVDQVVRYDYFIDEITRLSQSHHITYVETLAQSIADICLVDQRVTRVNVKVEKMSIYPNAKSVGIEIERKK